MTEISLISIKSERERAYWRGFEEAEGQGAPVALGKDVTPVWNQIAYRFRRDDGNETAATWPSPQNQTAYPGLDTAFRIRFEIEETATASPALNLVPQLQYNKNGAGWNDVNAASSVVRSVATPNVADGAATTNQLTASARAFQAGAFDEADGVTAAIAGLSNEHTEIEYSILIRSADVAVGDVIELRVVNSSTPLDTYTATPSILVVTPVSILGSHSSGSAGATNTLTYGHTVSAGTDVLVVTVETRNGPVTSLTWGGIALSLVVAHNNGGVEASIWRLNTPSPATANIVVSTTGSTSGIVSGATNLDNVDATTGDTDFTNGSTSVSLTLTTSPGDMVIDALAGPDNGSGSTPTIGDAQTQLHGPAIISDTRGRSSRESPIGTETEMSWTTLRTENWRYVAAVFKPLLTADKAVSENAAINVTESPSIESQDAKAASENAALNVTESQSIETQDAKNTAENAAFNITEVNALDVGIAAAENAAVNVTESPVIEGQANVATAESAAINVTDASAIGVLGDFPPHRIRVEVFLADGVTFAGEGPIVEALAARYRYAFDQIGAYEFTCPANTRNGQALVEGRVVHIYREGEGLVFKGIIDRIQARIKDEQPIMVVSGGSESRQLVWSNTKFGREFEGASLATISSTLLSGTGWSAGVLGTPTNDAFTIRYDSVPIWPALERVATAAGFHMRENPWDKEVDIDAFGADSGIVLQNVSQGDPALEENNDLFPIKGLTVVTDSADVWNSVEPHGAGEGINKLTLKQSTRSSPYAIQNEAQPDGQQRYFIEDAASIAAYGKRMAPLLFKDVQPLSLTAAGFLAASNVLYDVSSTWLARHGIALKTYAVDVSGLRHINLDGSRRLMPGDKVRVIYRGIHKDAEGTLVWLNVDALLWVMEMERSFDSKGVDTWRFSVATVDRFGDDDAQIMADAISGLRAIQVAPRPFTYREIHGPFRNSVDGSNPIQLVVNYDDNIYLVHQAKLTFTIRGLRANASGASSGGGATSSAGTSHTHSVSGGTSASGGGAHSHNVSSVSSQSESEGNVEVPLWVALNSSHETNQPSVASTGLQSGGHTHNETGGTTGTENQNHSHSMQSHFHNIPSAALTFPVSTGNHTHQVTGQSATSSDISHTHSFSGSTSGGEASHTHTVSAHTHGVSFGITQQSTPGAMAVTVTINGVSRTAALGGPWNTSQTLDITQYLTDANGQPLRQDNIIQLGASQLGDLEMTVRSMVTSTSLIPV